MPIALRLLLEILGIILCWLNLMIIVLIHEVGHLAGYKLAKGDDDWRISLGVGKRLLETKHLRVHMVPWAGYFDWKNPQPFTKKEAILIGAGGPFFSLMLALILLAFQLVVPEWRSIFIDYFSPTFAFVINYNICILIFSIIPMKYPGFIPLLGNHLSDGMHILRLLKGKKGV